MPQTPIGTNGPGQRGQLGSATAYRTWQTGSQNWISPEFGATYSVRVFLDNAGRTTSNTTGTELFATASGEEWFFDYQSGVLNFSGTNLPSGISTKSVYISGARYTGEIGIANTVNTAAAAFAHANAAFAAANTGASSAAAFNQANSAFFHANAAFTAANNATDTYVRNHANAAFDAANAATATDVTQNNSIASAFVHANAAFANANSYITYNEAVSVTQNNSIASAFVHANAAFTAANNATDTFVRNHANAAFDTANGAVAVNTTQNNSITVALDTANAAFSNANSYITYNEAVSVTQNNSITAAFAAANAATATDVTQNNSIASAFIHANAAFASANTIDGVNTTQNNSIASSFVHANAAFTRANNSLNANTGGTITGDVIVIGNVSANIVSTTGSNGIISGANAIFANYVYAANGNVDLYIYATKAFDVANAASSGSAADSFARNQANASFTAANGAVAVNLTQNNSIASAFIHANAAFLAANNATDTFVRNHANAAFDTANGAVAVNLTQNNSITVALNTANAAFSNANGYITYNEAVNVTQNSSIAAAFLAANAATATDATQNNSITVALDTANAAFAAANAATGGSAADSFARNQANAAFIRANNSLDANSGGTITGNVSIAGNLSVFGNVFVSGNTFSVDAGSLIANDTVLIMGTGNYFSDILDIGFASHYNDGANAHTGLIRDAGTKEWTLFKSYTPEILANNNIDINHPSFEIDTLNANLHSTTVTIKNIDILPYANGIYNTANAAFASANSIDGVNTTQNNSITAAFLAANAATATDATQNNSIASAFVHANAAFANANSYITYNEAVNVTQNNSIGAVFLQSNNNVGVDLTQNNSIAAAFTRANNSLNANTGGTVNGDVIFVGNVTSNTLTTTGSNGSITGANAIFANYIFAANSNVDLYIYATRAFETANAATGGSATDSFARNQANGAFTAANGAVAVNLTQNNSIAAVFIHANAAFANANSYITYNEAVNVTQNNSIASAFIHANAAFASANNIDGVNTTQNNSITAAFSAANAATATDTTQNNSITAAFVRANNSLDANNGGTITGDIVITGNLTANIVGGTF
jgi:hypothetical protein